MLKHGYIHPQFIVTVFVVYKARFHPSFRGLFGGTFPHELWPGGSEHQGAERPGGGGRVFRESDPQRGSAGPEGLHSPGPLQERCLHVRRTFPVVSGTQHSGLETRSTHTHKEPFWLWTCFTSTNHPTVLCDWKSSVGDLTALHARPDGWILPLWAKGKVSRRGAVSGVWILCTYVLITINPNQLLYRCRRKFKHSGTVPPCVQLQHK